VVEETRRKPINDLGMSKLKAEQVVEGYLESLKRHGDGALHAVVLRPSSVYGGESDHEERMVPSFITRGLSHLPIQVVGGEQMVSTSCLEILLLGHSRVL
jgi:nucleoside-diphosphate-sugar epimerase